MKITKTLLFTGFLLSAVASGSAQSITADFNDSTNYSTSFTGNNDGEQTAVDQWGGIPGDGWISSWMVETNGSSVRDKQVRWGAVDPTGEEGKFVQFRMQATGKQGRRWINSRAYGSYGAVNMNKRVMFEFIYRPDDTSAFASGGSTFIEIKDGGQLWKNEGTTWLIATVGAETKRWAFANGDGVGGFDRISSDMEIVAGNAYKFTILADPTSGSWGVAIDNLNDAADPVVQRDLGFINKRSAHAGKLSFLTQISCIGDSTTSYNYSLASIKISAGE